MSTQLRRVAQAPAHSPVRTKFFLALASTSGGAAVVSAANAASVMTEGQFSTAAPSTTGLASGALYRDMGREIVVTNAAGAHIQKWRAVQLVSGATTEGVGADNNLYARVWDATGSGVYVARTG